MKIITPILDDKGTLRIPPSLCHLVKKGQIVTMVIDDWGTKTPSELLSRAVKRNKRGVQK